MTDSYFIFNFLLYYKSDIVIYIIGVLFRLNNAPARSVDLSNILHLDFLGYSGVII